MSNSAAAVELLARATALSAGCDDEELRNACERLRRAIAAPAARTSPARTVVNE